MAKLSLSPQKQYNSCEEIDDEDIKHQTNKFISCIYFVRRLREGISKSIVPLHYQSKLIADEKKAYLYYLVCVNRHFSIKGRQDIGRLIDLKVRDCQIKNGDWQPIKHPVPKGFMLEVIEKRVKVENIYNDYNFSPEKSEGLKYFYNYRNLYKETPSIEKRIEIKDQLDLLEDPKLTVRLEQPKYIESMQQLELFEIHYDKKLAKNIKHKRNQIRRNMKGLSFALYYEIELEQYFSFIYNPKDANGVTDFVAYSRHKHNETMWRKNQLNLEHYFALDYLHHCKLNIYYRQINLNLKLAHSV